MWCKIPKAASTSWLHAFIKLSHVPETQIPEVKIKIHAWDYSANLDYYYDLKGLVSATHLLT